MGRKISENSVLCWYKKSFVTKINCRFFPIPAWLLCGVFLLLKEPPVVYCNNAVHKYGNAIDRAIQIQKHLFSFHS